MTKATLNTRVSALENRMDAMDSKLDLILKALEPQPAKKDTRKPVTKKSAGKKATAKADKPDLRLAKQDAIDLMVTSWHNRAASAYGRAHALGSVLYADLDAKQRKGITKAQKEQAYKDLLASDKWARTAKRHGLVPEDLAW